MTDQYSKVSKFIIDKNLISRGDSVLAAISGGADSMCMLDILISFAKEYEIKLGVVSVNHNFREEAKDETEYVKSFCEKRNIPFFLKEIEKGMCEATEEAARIFRYRLINEVAADNDYDTIALAHNANDRAETLLFNLFRGTGITGMAAIRPKRDRYIRPVLCLKRDEIEDYLKKKDIRFCTDSTNLEDDYSRNRIRHHIIPVSEDINAASIEHMNNSAEYLDEIRDFLDKISSEAFNLCTDKDSSGIYIDVCKILENDRIVRWEIIRKCIFDMTPHLKDITSDHVQAVDMLFLREGNRRISLPYGINAYREYERVYISNERTDEEKFVFFPDISADTLKFTLSDGKKISLRYMDVSEISGNIYESIPRNKYTKWFDYDTINSAVCIRTRREGDYLIIDESGRRKSLSRVLIDAKIPERIRDLIPVVAVGEEILWVPGLRDSCAYRINDNTKKILVISQEE